MDVKEANGQLVKVFYRHRTRVPRWWPFRWPKKWVDDAITCDNIACPSVGEVEECSEDILFEDSDGQIWVRDPGGVWGLHGPFSALEVYE